MIRVSNKMDSLQETLLEMLEEDARVSISQLADVTGVSRKRVKETIDRMIDRGIIRRFTIERGKNFGPAPELQKAIFNVRLKSPSCRQLFQDIQSSSIISCAWSVSSSELDMVVLVEAKSMDQIEELRNKIARHPLVHTMFTNSVLTTWRDFRTDQTNCPLR